MTSSALGRNVPPIAAEGPLSEDTFRYQEFIAERVGQRFMVPLKSEVGLGRAENLIWPLPGSFKQQTEPNQGKLWILSIGESQV